jgi:VIT1/CCC1 family predicted Fe2+/Mn2+ transporter
MNKLTPDQFRNFVFGAEDSLVSTMGVLFGIASASGFTPHQIFVAGIITIVVEATSMGAGSFLSETSTNEADRRIRMAPISDGLIMFLSYFFAGFIPLAPYLLIDVSSARYASVGASLVALFILGYLPAKNVKSGLRMAVIAGFAAGIGFLVAHIFNS